MQVRSMHVAVAAVAGSLGLVFWGGCQTDKSPGKPLNIPVIKESKDPASKDTKVAKADPTKTAKTDPTKTGTVTDPTKTPTTTKTGTGSTGTTVTTKTDTDPKTGVKTETKVETTKTETKVETKTETPKVETKVDEPKVEVKKEEPKVEIPKLPVTTTEFKLPKSMWAAAYYKDAKVGDWVMTEFPAAPGTKNKQEVIEIGDHMILIENSSISPQFEFKSRSKMLFTEPDPETKDTPKVEVKEKFETKMEDETVKVAGKDVKTTRTETTKDGKLIGKMWTSKDVPLGGMVKTEDGEGKVGIQLVDFGRK